MVGLLLRLVKDLMVNGGVMNGCSYGSDGVRGFNYVGFLLFALSSLYLALVLSEVG